MLLAIQSPLAHLVNLRDLTRSPALLDSSLSPAGADQQLDLKDSASQ